MPEGLNAQMQQLKKTFFHATDHEHVPTLGLENNLSSVSLHE